MAESMMKYAKKCIKKEPMPKSLEKEFVNNGLENLLESVYQRTEELLKENQVASKERI